MRHLRGLLVVAALIALLAGFAAWCDWQQERVLERAEALADSVEAAQQPPETLRMLVRLTAYDTVEPDGSVWRNRATGGRLRPGDCAVDPAVIPLGSTVVLPCGTRLLATDVGAAVRGRAVDQYRPGSFHDRRLWRAESLEVLVIIPARAGRRR